MKHNLFVMIIFISLFAVDVHAGTPTIVIQDVSGLYAGETKSTTATVYNNNNVCDYESCTWSTSDDSGSTGYISHGGGSQSFSVRVRAPGGCCGSSSITINAHCAVKENLWCFYDDDLSDTATITYSYCGDGTKQSQENCGNCIQDAPCPSGYHCESSSCVRDIYCGDGYKNQASEQCDGSDLGGASCKSLGYDYGSLSCSSCSYNTNNCGRCTHECSSGQKECVGTGGYRTCSSDQNSCRKWASIISCGPTMGCSNGNCISLATNQNCGDIGRSCASTEECFNGVCRSKCGNGNRDSGENCANCPSDVSCDSNQACSTSGQCIQLGDTQNCASIGDSCGNGFCDNNRCVECRATEDCLSKKGKESTGKYECSTDRRGRYEIFVEKGGQCVDGKCTGSNEMKSTYPDSCGDQPCYNGQCGCPEGYGACTQTWNCVKRGTILVGDNCECDVQCESGFCKEGKCIKTIDVTLSSTQATLKPGEETIITLTVISNLDEDVKGGAVLKIGTGSEIVDISSTVSECSGNVCKISGTLPGRGSDEISVTLKSNSEVSIPVSGGISYKVEGQDVQIVKKMAVEFTEKSNIVSGIPKNYFIYGGAAVAVIILALFYFIGKSHRPLHKKEEKKQETEKESKKEERICEKCGQIRGMLHFCKGKKEEEPKPKGSTAKEIKRLHSLMEKGVITRREFKKAKKRLLKGSG